MGKGASLQPWGVAGLPVLQIPREQQVWDLLLVLCWASLRELVSLLATPEVGASLSPCPRAWGTPERQQVTPAPHHSPFPHAIPLPSPCCPLAVASLSPRCPPSPARIFSKPDTGAGGREERQLWMTPECRVGSGQGQGPHFNPSLAAQASSTANPPKITPSRHPARCPLSSNALSPSRDCRSGDGVASPAPGRNGSVRGCRMVQPPISICGRGEYPRISQLPGCVCHPAPSTAGTASGHRAPGTPGQQRSQNCREFIPTWV